MPFRRKGRSSQSIYNMSSLHCRSEFLEKPDLGPKRETHFSFPGARRVQAEDKQVVHSCFQTIAFFLKMLLRCCNWTFQHQQLHLPILESSASLGAKDAA